MRSLIVCNAASLDGYYEEPNRNIMALFDYRWEAYPADESFDAHNAGRLREADTLLLGRTSYEGFKVFWPPVVDDDSATALQQEISRLNNATERVVVSDNLTPRRDGSLAQHSYRHPGGRPRADRRAPPDGLPGRARRRHPDVRRPAGSIAPAYRHPYVGGLGERAHTVRGTPGDVTRRQPPARSAGADQ